MVDTTLSLRDRIKKQQAEQEEAQRDSNPYKVAISPMAFGSSSPDQNKMAGTPAQKQSELQSAVSVETTPTVQPKVAGTVEKYQQQAAGTSQDLAEAKTTQQYQADAATERAQAWSEAMSSFGSLGGRVQSLIMNQLGGGALDEGQVATAGTSFEVNDDLVAGYASPGQEGAVKAALESFQSAATPEAAFQALAAASSSFKDPNSALMEIIGNSYKNDPAAQQQVVANAIANNIIDPDQLTIDQLVQSGMLSVDEQGTITELGLTEDQVQEMLGNDWNTLTPAQIEERLDQFQSEELDKKNQIMEQLADPSLDPAARESLIGELKRLGQIGELEAEQVAEESRKLAADSGMIVFDGQVQDVSELLSDENIQEQVKEYLLGGEGADAFRESNPDFAEWIDREMSELKGKKQELDQRLDQFQNIQAENEQFRSENLADEAGGASLSSNLMDALGFGDGFQAAAFDPSTNAIYKELQGIKSSEATKNAVEQLNRLSPEALEELKGEFLSGPEGAKELVAILENPTHSKNLIKALELDSQIDAADSVEDMTRAVTGQSSQAIQSTLNSLRLNAALGDEASRKQLTLLSSMFDTNGDGKVDADPAVVSAAIKKAVGGSTLESLVKKGMSGISNSFASADTSAYRGSNTDAHNKLASYAANDGKITADELRSLTTSFASNPNAGAAFLDSIRNNPQLMTSMGIDPKAVSAQLGSLASAQVKDATKGSLVSLDRYLANPGEAASEMANSATWNTMMDAEKSLQQLLSKATTPEQRSVIQSKLDEIEEATGQIYLNDWGQELNASFGFSEKMFSSPEQLKAILPPSSHDLIDKSMVRRSDGSWFVPPIKNALHGYSPDRQNLMKYIIAAQKKGKL